MCNRSMNEQTNQSKFAQRQDAETNEIYIFAHINYGKVLTETLAKCLSQLKLKRYWL